MAINFAQENTFPLAETPDNVPRRRGRKINKATPFRWKDMGLEVICIGGVLHTSTEALQRFFERRTAAKCGEPVAVEPCMSSSRRREVERAQRELAAARI
jgi:hypothetical protein